jgi:hypothetical protein
MFAIDQLARVSQNWLMTREENRAAIIKHSADLKAKRPDIDHRGQAYVIALNVLQLCLGHLWMQTHVLGTTSPTDFFRNDWATPGRRSIHMARVINLAEMIINLQDAPGFHEKSVRCCIGGM